MFESNTKFNIVMGVTWYVAIPVVLFPFTAAFYLQAYCIFMSLAIAARWSLAKLKGYQLNLSTAIEDSSWLALLMLCCSGLSGVMFAMTVAATDYMYKNKIAGADNLWWSFAALVLLLPIALYALAVFAPQVVVFLANIPELLNIIVWGAHLLYIFYMASLLGVGKLQNLFNWRKGSSRQLLLTVAGIAVFLLTSPALFVLSNYAAIGMLFSVSSLVYQLVGAVFLYAIQPLVEELIARTGLWALLKYYGYAGENKAASFAQRFQHTFVLGLLMGFLFGFMHTSVTGAAFFGLSALIYHTMMGMMLSYATLWSGGIELASVFHSLHNFSVSVYILSKEFAVKAFSPVFFIPVFLGRLLLSWMSVKVVEKFCPESKDAFKPTPNKPFVGPQVVTAEAALASDVALAA